MLSSDWERLRLIDLLYNSPEENASLKELVGKAGGSEDPNFGTGAPNFLKFITDELIPYVEAHYNVSTSDRTYMGYSGGGAFGLYVLGTRPEIFKRYVLGSSFKTSYLDRFEKKLADSKNLNIRLYFGVGLDEPIEGVPLYEDFVSGFDRLARILNKQRASGVSYHYQAFPDQVHGTTWLYVFSIGLRWVFLEDCKPYLYADHKCPAAVVGQPIAE